MMALIDRDLKKRLGVATLWSAGLVAFPIWVKLLYPDISEFYLPSYGGLLLGVLSCFLMSLICNSTNRFVASAWLLWFFLGSLNSISSYVVLGPHYRPFLDFPTIIYFAFTAAMFVGMVAVERIWHRVPDAVALVWPQLNALHLTALAVFCGLWAVTLVLYAGYVPIFSGTDITESIYETNYGPLYGFGIILAIAAVAFCVRTLQGSTSRLAKPCGAIAVLSVIAISFLDGKRYLAIIIILGCCFSLLRIYGARRARVLLVSMLGVAASLYLVVFVVRQGLDVQRYGDGWLSATFIAGVEFRDFVYSVERYQPGSVPNYSWLSSAFAAMLNGKLLSLLGFDKQLLVGEGSAFAWSKLFNSPYGIRTGIVSELWFAYGWWGMAVASLIGGIMSRVSIAISRAITDKQLVNRCVVLALLTTLIMGQTTSVTGSMTVLLYLNIAFYAAQKILKTGSHAAKLRLQIGA